MTLRDQMPTIAGWVDDLRAAFGRGEVDAWVRAAMRAGTLYAREGGQQIGEPMAGDWVVTVSERFRAEDGAKPNGQLQADFQRRDRRINWRSWT